MKNVISPLTKVVASIAITSTLYLNTQAQTSSAKTADTTRLGNFIIKVDPFWPILSAAMGPYTSRVYSTTVENFIGPHLSVQLNGMLSHYTYSFNDMYNSYETDNTYYLSPELKYYLGKAGKYRGGYAGVFAQYYLDDDYHQSNVQQIDFYTRGYGGGFMAGVQYYICKRFTVEVLLGLGHLKIYYPASNLYYEDSFINTAVADINLGYRF